MKHFVSFSERKKIAKREAELNTYGLVLDEITEKITTGINDKVFVCLLRSILIFMATLGSLGSAVSAFGLSYNPLIVYPSLLLLSVLISFLYYNKICFYLGYICFFLVFSIGSVSFYFYINSGFQAFLNVMYEKYSDYFLLSSVREATEFIADRNLTVSIAMVFLGAFLAILLNISISGYMSLVETFIFTFPFLELGLYIDLMPAYPYLIMLFVVYISVGILHRSGHYKFPSIKQHKQLYFVTKKKNKVTYSYISNGKGMMSVFGISAVFAALFLILGSGIFYSTYNSRAITNKLKASTDEYIKMFIQGGAWSFFDRYKSTGGLNNGRLGGVSSVRPDYETDLVATFVPTSASSIYLKSFTGLDYSSDGFSPDSTRAEHFNGEIKNYHTNSMYAFSDYSHTSNTLAKMRIENIDAGILDLMPYDTIMYGTNGNIIKSPYALHDIPKTLLEDGTDLIKAEDRFNSPEYESVSVKNYIYDPYIFDVSYPKSEIITDEFQQEAYDLYLNVPENIEETLKDICDEAGLLDIADDINDSDSFEAKQEARLKMLVTLKNYFINEFDYTMAPGSTPYRKDTVQYFLADRRRGFCAHFAASATLLLREMGIPARYVEGYCIQLSDILDSTALSTDTAGWINSIDNIPLAETGVVSVEVTDGSAHAWVEVFIDGYGWIPYEFTPPSSEDEPAGGFNFARLFSGLLLTRPGNNNNATNNADANPSDLHFTFDFGNTFGFLATPMIIVIVLTIIGIIIAALSGNIVCMLKIRFYEKAGKYNAAIEQHLQLLVKKLAKSEIQINTGDTLQNIFDSIRKYLADKTSDTQISPDSINDIERIIGIALFSNKEVNEESYNDCVGKMKMLFKSL